MFGRLAAAIAAALAALEADNGIDTITNHTSTTHPESWSWLLFGLLGLVLGTTLLMGSSFLDTSDHWLANSRLLHLDAVLARHDARNEAFLGICLV